MKKSRTSLFRILILSLVMLVTVFILVMAWFSTKNQATASGLSVKAVSGLGLECSFNNNEYSSSISRAPTSNFKFPLITGDGTNFFIPALDRSSGIPLKNAAGSWISKRNAVATHYPQKGESYVKGDYYVEDIWFQSDKQLDVYLTSESSIKPLDADKTSDQWERKSDYGDFSKDNIAGAARVAFFQLDPKTPGGSNIVSDAVDKTAPEFIWIPNEKYQLTTSDNLTPVTNDGGTTTGVTFNPDGTPKEQWWNDLLVSDNKIAGGYHVAEEGKKKYLYYYDFKDTEKTDGTEVLKATEMYVNDSGEYVGVMDIEKAGNVNYMYGVFDKPMDEAGSYKSSLGNFAHDSEPAQWVPYDRETHALYYDETWIFSYELAKSRNAAIKPLGENVNLKWAQLYLQRTDNADYSKYKRWQIRITFNPKTKVLNIGDIILYENKDHYITTPTIGSVIGGDNQKKYVIKQDTVVITNNTTQTTDITYGLNAMDSSTNAVRLDMKSVTGKTYISPQNPLPSQLFAVEKTSGTYKFKSLSTGKYLAIDGGKLVLSATGSSFTIEGSDSSAPMLKTTDGYYLTFYNGNFGVSTTSEYASLQIYEGSEFRFDSNGSTEIKSGLNYTYYKAGAKALTILNKATLDTSGYLLSGDLNTKPVVRLTKQSDDNYKAHIRIKIWVEGTDREAKIPLAGGIFSTTLLFQGKEVTTTTP